jgi:hypothetical protein
MRKTYTVLAWAITVLVVVQAMAIAFALFGLGKWVEDGGTFDKAAMESDKGIGFTGEVGFMIHGMFGEMLIPLVAIALLVVSFFTKVPGATKWAGFVLLDIVVQIALAFISFGAPVIGPLHALNAFVLAMLGVLAARRVGAVATTTAAPAPSAVT